MKTQTEEYIPGTCNIGAQEIKKRKMLALTGIVLSIIYALVIYYFSLDRIWRLPIFIPAYMAAIGLLQVRNRFCVRYGMQGESSMGDAKIKQNHMDADRKRAIKIIVYCLVIAAFVTAIIYYFPI